MPSEPEAESQAGGRDRPSPEQAGHRLVYLAAERTLLTWIRTAIAVIVLGFAVDRFGLIAATDRGAGLRGAVWSSRVGLVLIVTGVVTLLASALRYQRFSQRYERGDDNPGAGIPQAIVLACLLALAGAGLAIFLGLESG